MTWATPDGDGTRLRLHIQPRASRTEVAGLHGDALRIRLAAPPVDGAANDALLRFLADRLGVPRSTLSLVGGEASRRKTVRAATLPPEVVASRLAPPTP
ncbi:MAG TPA: DUF167 family protein [Gemmatimonadales bacterium]|nr:DUF167 family protein [Gemmatimonadales bacterium]